MFVSICQWKCIQQLTLLKMWLNVVWLQIEQPVYVENSSTVESHLVWIFGKYYLHNMYQQACHFKRDKFLSNSIWIESEGRYKGLHLSCHHFDIPTTITACHRLMVIVSKSLSNILIWLKSWQFKKNNLYDIFTRN